MTKTEIQVPAKIEGAFNLAKIKFGFQALMQEYNSLVFNEDNVEKIKEYLAKIRKAEIKVEEVHKVGKEPSLLEGKQWDLAKRNFLSELDKIKPTEKFNTLCKEIARRNAEAAAATARKEAILKGIEDNSVAFAKMVTECTTSKQLTDIERLINLEKGKKSKYAEFLPDAIEVYNKLNSIVASQKVLVKKLEDIENQKLEAIENGDDEKGLSLQDISEQLSENVMLNNINVQEEAINAAVSMQPVFKQVFPTVKAKRTVWKFEISNEKDLLKLAPELAVISLDSDKVKVLLNELKENELKNKEELIFKGVRFYKDISY